MVNSQQLYDLLKSLFIILDDGDRRLFSQYNLTVPRFYTLYHLEQEPGISLSHLSDRLLCDKSNATRLVKGLEADGLVFRRRHETDGRVLRLFLSEAGRKTCRQLVQAHHEYNRQRFSALVTLEQETLLEGLQKLKDSLEEELH